MDSVLWRKLISYGYFFAVQQKMFILLQVFVKKKKNLEKKIALIQFKRKTKNQILLL